MILSISIIDRLTMESRKKKKRRGSRGSKKENRNVEPDEDIFKLIKNESKKCVKFQGVSEIPRDIMELPSGGQVNRRKKKNVQIEKMAIQQANVSKKNLLAKSTRHRYKIDKPVGQSDRKCKKPVMMKLSAELSDMNITNGDTNDELQFSITEISQKFTFPKSIKREKMREILQSKNKNSQQYYTGTLRINPKNPMHAYVTIGKDDEDIMINGYCDRNRALERDVVAIKIHPQEAWLQKPDGKYQKTGAVVTIIEKVHSRNAIGILLPHKEGFRFQARDRRFPLLIINPSTLPEEYKRKDTLKKKLLIGKMLDWSKPSYCSGKILGSIGNVGELEAENEAIIIENGLDVSPYDEKLIKDLPSVDYVIKEEDLIGREDWRNQCVFTIDPATAVDLDDAVSCRRLENGNFEVGVHIADVTYFLQASSPLDKLVSERATTVYLANTVYHMLPKSLCQLCSLLPGQDRLTFSVILEITAMGEVINHRFTRSIINSSLQMSYQQAQKIIERPNFDWSEMDLPVPKSDFSLSDICRAVTDLYGISKYLRSKRFEGGALSIDQPKIQIILDEETKLPVSYCLEERLESNELIEEFMLLANMTVARHLYKKFPKTALLRHHDPPKLPTLTKLLHPLKNYGVHLDTKSAGELRKSMTKYDEIGDGESEEEFVAHCRMMVINTLCAQAMVRANYVCSGTFRKKAQLRHYALNVPFYTHFTSPIRRYSDCIVHRLLASSIDKNIPLPPDWSTELCSSLAKHCNKMKDSAKNAQEKSIEIYFTHLLAHNGPVKCPAIVMNVRNHSLDVILGKLGLTLQVDLMDIQKYASLEYSNEASVQTINVKWKETEITQVINVFTIINLRIRKHPKFYYMQASLMPPKETNKVLE